MSGLLVIIPPFPFVSPSYQEASERATKDAEAEQIAQRIVELTATVDDIRKRVADAERGVGEVMKKIDAFDRDAVDLKEEATALEKLEQDTVS